MRALLDTSVVIGGVPAEVDEAALSVVTLAELQFGIAVASGAAERQRRLARLGAISELFDPLPVDGAVATAWGGLAAAAQHAGRQPRRRAMDLLIAATAQVHGLVLVTRDDDLRWLGEVIDVRFA